MRVGLTPEQAALRAEVRAFLEAEMTPAFYEEFEKVASAEDHWSQSFSRKLAERGWLTLAWPAEYGGAGRPLSDAAIVNEQLGAYWAPEGWHFVGSMWVALQIFEFGTEEQKRRLLPGIASAEHCYGPAFTEPQAGSDLAAIRCEAVRDGDEYVLNGFKCFSTSPMGTTHLWLLAITDKQGTRHDRMSMFVVPTSTPGITVVPKPSMNHGYMNDILLENARIPAANLIGTEHKGWRVAMSTFNVERSGVAQVAALQSLLRDLIAFARGTTRDGKPLIERESVRRAFAWWATELEAQKVLSWKVIWQYSKGERPSVEPSVQSLRVRMDQHPFANFAMEILGMYGQLTPASKWTALRGRIERLYLFSSAQHSGGTTEIQKNIIATLGLGLPRG